MDTLTATTLAIEIFNSIADRKDGTLSASGRDLPTSGYFVGGVGKALVFDSFEQANESGSLRRITEFLRGQSAAYVGWWADSETGKIYIDGTSWFEYPEQAIEAAFRTREIAFWDIEEAREWRFTYTPVEV